MSAIRPIAKWSVERLEALPEGTVVAWLTLWFRGLPDAYSRGYQATHKRKPRPRPAGVEARRPAADMAEDFHWLYLTGCGWGEILTRLRYRSWDGVVQRLRDADRPDLVTMRSTSADRQRKDDAA